MPPSLFHSTVCAALLSLAGPVMALDSPPQEDVHVQTAAELDPSDNLFGQEVIETLADLLQKDPEQARRYFLEARARVAAARAADRTSVSGKGGDRERSVSALGSALGGALQRVEVASQPGDPRLPGIIASAAAMLAADDGCGVEGNASVRFHVGVMMHKAATTDGTFHVQSLVEKLGPLVKETDLPVLLGAARHMTWGVMRDDTAGQQWLAAQAADGEHRALARLLLAAVRISLTEADSGNVPRAGILQREKLPDEQQWLLDMLESKTLPPAARAACGTEILRQWPTAEPPLRYVAARALADAWQVDVPVNPGEAALVLTSLRDLTADSKAPGDEGFPLAVQALAAAWEQRLVLNRTPRYGWNAAEIRDESLAGHLYLLCLALNPGTAERFLTFSLAEASRDASLACTLQFSEGFHKLRLYPEAVRILDTITPEREADPAVDAERRTHIAIKRCHYPLDAAAAAGKDAAAQATVALLTGKNDDPAAWTGAAWSWHIWARDRTAAGETDEAVLGWCMSFILTRAAAHLAPDTYGKYQPASEAKCREVLEARQRSSNRVRMLRTTSGIQMLLDAFEGSWNDLPAAVRDRLMAGANAS